MLSRLKDLLIGSPLPTHLAGERKLNKIRALAAFSPDALSSIAYANQEIYLGLIAAGTAGLVMAWPIGIAITILLVIVAISYYQTVHGYPTGGGSYIVASKNLGTIPGLVAASSLLIDYLLTAAVSLTAGVEAIASAYPVLWPYRIVLSLVLLAIITLINLRGLHETGTAMAVPVYLFLFTYLPMLGYGLIRLGVDGSSVPTPAILQPVPVTWLLVLHAFATGCTALSGIEAISNGVPAFRPPESQNAGKTLIAMAVLMGLLFLGSIGLTQYLGIVPGPSETILSALARRLLGNGFFYQIIQISTLLILAVAANTSFADFPRLSAILATDGFLPRQFAGLGDRLVFSNGIVALSFVTGMLIIVFGGASHALIPLFAVGVYLSFTLSQAGMVVHWIREKSRGWQLKTFLNGFGAMATAITVLVVGFSKFLDGAWLTVLLIPAIGMVFLRIKTHYKDVSQELTLRGLPPSLKPFPPPRIVIPISGVHRGIIDAVDFARSISKNVTGVYVELEPGTGSMVLKNWERWFPDVKLEVVPSPYRSVVGPLLDFLDRTDEEHNDGQLAVVLLPEFVPARWWQSLMHNQTAWTLKAALLYRRRHSGFQRVIIDVPFHLTK